MASTISDGYTEPRLAGLRRLDITFVEEIDPATAVPGAVTIVGATSGDVSHLVSGLSLNGSGTVLTVELSASPPDGDTYTVTVTDTLRTPGGAIPVGDRDIVLHLLAGDINGSGHVSPADLLAVRAAAGQALTAETAQVDLDGSGTVSGADMLHLRSLLGNALP
jgi:hypothetical protein